MSEKSEELRKPLRANEIEFRIQSIVNRPIENEWKICAHILAYKDARCDMNRLDSVFGFDGWQRLHKEHKGMLFGGVAIKNEQGEWVEKWDVGEASNTHADKGLASDSFKRACFNLGIGRELYDYPTILVPLSGSEFEEYDDRGKKKYRAKYALNIKEWTWFNQFNEDGELTFLGAKQHFNGGKSKLRYEWGSYTKQEGKSE